MESKGVIPMVRTIRARFSKGVFEPLEPDVNGILNEGDEVLIMVSTPIEPEAPDPLVASAGGWKGLVDAEALKRHIYADRLVATRSPVTL
jgi:predicted DNA-binding antitoxin AbrB/MazE fold protein